MSRYHRASDHDEEHEEDHDDEHDEDYEDEEASHTHSSDEWLDALQQQDDEDEDGEGEFGTKTNSHPLNHIADIRRLRKVTVWSSRFLSRRSWPMLPSKAGPLTAPKARPGKALQGLRDESSC
jgi:ABC-type nickel/cobalt efflux system permease component RcnA